MPGFVRRVVWGLSAIAAGSLLLALLVGQASRLLGMATGMFLFSLGMAVYLRWQTRRLAAWRGGPYGQAMDLYRGVGMHYGERCIALATRLRYLGGHPDLPDPIDGVFLYLLKTQLVIAHRSGNEVAGASLPVSWLRRIEVTGNEVSIEAENYITVRLTSEAPEEAAILAETWRHSAA